MRVELEPDVVRAERQKIVTTFAGQAKIPGFRPGKVPSEVIEKRYRKAIDDELRDRLVRLGCRDGIAKENIEVINVTDIDDVELHDDDSFSFTAQLQTAPEVELPEYRGIPVTVQRVEVTDHDVDHELDHIRMELGEMIPVSSRSAQTGDHALVDIKTELDGVPVGDAVSAAASLSWIEGSWLPIHEDVLFPGFGSQIVGQGIGEVREFDLVVPADYRIEELREKKLHFTVTVLELKERRLPEWNDELAANLLGGQGGMTELRDRLRERIRMGQVEERNREIITQILGHLDSQTSFELPASVLAQETQRQVNQIVRRSHMQGASDGDVMEHKEKIIRYASNQAEANVKTSFILRQISEKEGVQAEEREILQYCAQQAHEAGVSVKKFIGQLKKANMIGDVIDNIVRVKTLDLLRDSASVTETDRAPHHCDHPDHQTA